MKLNIKTTILIGFAFLSISAFWQMYDSLVPLMLTKTFAIDKTFSGAIMAADNVLALVLLPLFGSMSDRCRHPLGRRKPYILYGTIGATALMAFLPLLDNSYAAAPALWKFIAFVGVLACLLFAMGTYRSPAVALMPDVTPKPLRSKGNAVINLMGAVGGILYLGITSVLYSKSRTEGLDHIDYLPIFLIVAGIMIASLLIILLFVNEPKLVAEQKRYEDAHPEDDLTATAENGHKVIPKAVRRSLLFVLSSVALWYIGYNAITTWFTTYATTVWNMATGQATLCLTIATAGAIASYIPVGILAGRIGRKKVILIGAATLSSCFLIMFIYTLFAHSFHPVLIALFVLVGVSWASINVNSLPMVVEMCSGADVGKFTGYYYTFSMAAQVLTPVLSGFLYDHVSEKVLFIYAAVAVALSFMTMTQVRHGDNRFIGKRGLEAFDFED